MACPFPPKLFALIALVAVTNTALINMLMASRLVYGMSREGIVPRLLGLVHAARRTPFVGREASVYLTAGILLGIGLVLWFVNRVIKGKTDDVDAERLVSAE